MPPVGAAIGGLLGIGGAGLFGGITFGGVATALLKVAAGIGLTYAGRALAGKPEDLMGVDSRKPSGVQADPGAGDSLPRTVILGRWATPGSVVYMRAAGDTNKTPHAYLYQVVRLSDIPVNGLVDVFVDGSKVTYGAGSQGDRGFAIPEYRKDGKDYLWVKFHNGNQTQADSYLTSKFSSGNRDWDVNHIGTGVAYAIVTSRYNEKLFSGRPQVLFVIEGAKLYDITKDSSVGGSGTHRWGTPSTWEYTVNPMVMIYNLMRGLQYKGRWVYGLQTVSPAQLPFSSWAAAINECDLIVTNRDGSTNKQYRAGAEISWDTEVGAEIQELLKTCNGKIADCGGVYKPKVGPDLSSGAAVFSFTDDSLMLSDEHEFSMFPSLDDTVNGIDATFIFPGDGWQEKALPPKRRADYEAQDDDRQNIADVTYAHVWDKAQAQRLSNAILKESRRFRRHVVVLPPEAYVLEPLDFVSWTSVRNGYSNKLFRVESISDRNNGDQIVGLQEVDPTDYDWSASEEVIIPDGVQIVDRPPPQAVISFTAAPATLAGDDGRSLPAIRAAWDGIDLDDVDKVKFEVRRNGTTAVISQPSSVTPEVGFYDITEGINGATAYEVRALFQDVDNRRDFTWSPWVDVFTPNTQIISNQIVGSLLNLINAGSAAGKVITQQVLPAPAGFQTLYRITVYGTGPNPVASGMYLYVSSTGVPGVIFDAATFAIGPFSSVPGDLAAKAKVFPFVIGSDGIVRLKRGFIEKLQAGQIEAGEIYAGHIHTGTITADKINGAEISQYYGLSANNAKVTVGAGKKGGLVLVGNFKYVVDRNDRMKVGITVEGSNTAIKNSLWQLEPNADMEGIATVVGLTSKDKSSTKSYTLKKLDGSANAFISSAQLVALRIYD